jgi:hypothetical protein
MSAAAGSGAYRIPLNTGDVPKSRLSGLTMQIGNIFSGIADKFTPSEWAMTSASGDPKGWIHEPEGNKKMATFGAGCYWGTEKFFCTEFAEKYPGAILGTSVGFMSPDKNAMKNPSYRQVCSGETGHVEVLHILYNADKCSYEEMVKFFYTFHDPTTKNRQGNDAGT